MRPTIAAIAWIAVMIGGVAATSLDFTVLWIFVGFLIYNLIHPQGPGPYAGGFPGEW